jgi:TRAP-type C4-dicarboxylate transport system substrate-binding protein
VNSLKIAFVNIKEHPHGLGARKFADIVAEKSGGKITASIPPSKPVRWTGRRTPTR